MDTMTRRQFVKAAAALAAVGAAAGTAPASSLPAASAARLPRWRGFNLLEKFIARDLNAPFEERDFAWIAEWGFNFVRLPMSYHCWSSPSNWREIREPVMQEIDAAVELGRRYGIHVCINFHRAPGYSVDRSVMEPFNLWTDTEALEAACYHWAHFAARYKGVSNDNLSFDLLNEPGSRSPTERVLLTDPEYARVVRALVAAIRRESPERLIIADGLMWGNVPVPALADLGIAQSGRGYTPMPISHWRASWIGGADKWPRPQWPLVETRAEVESAQKQVQSLRQTFATNDIVQRFAREDVVAMPWGRERLKRQVVDPWVELASRGVGVHFGEWGAHNQTPHDVVLAWMGDALHCLGGAGFGWSLWNLRGSFGVLDSERADVDYEFFRGHRLDRRMLELLRAG
jgi:endoglucanase